MVAFGGVARALRCAASMQRTFAAYSEAHPDRPIRVHIGIHTGEAMEEDDDFLGHTVIVASRIADVAGPGEILVSSLTAQMVERLEREIDALAEETTMPTEFLVPGENQLSAALDVARTVVRRAERVALTYELDGSFVHQYLNRLSDLVWAMARWAEGPDHRTARLHDQ